MYTFFFDMVKTDKSKSDDFSNVTLVPKVHTEHWTQQDRSIRQDNCIAAAILNSYTTSLIWCPFYKNSYHYLFWNNILKLKLKFIFLFSILNINLAMNIGKNLATGHNVPVSPDNLAEKSWIRFRHIGWDFPFDTELAV